MNFWEKKLKLATLSDVDGSLPRVEKIIGEVRTEGRPGSRKKNKTLTTKTLRNLIGTFDGLLNWCAHPKRGYLPANPLAGLQRFSAEPETIWRALEPDELRRLLDHASDYLRVLVMIAATTGLRLGELRQLTIDDFDEKTSRLRLKKGSTKNRKWGFKTLPAEIGDVLRQWKASGKALELYRRHNNRKDKK